MNRNIGWFKLIFGTGCFLLSLLRKQTIGSYSFSAPEILILINLEENQIDCFLGLKLIQTKSICLFLLNTLTYLTDLVFSLKYINSFLFNPQPNKAKLFLSWNTKLKKSKRKFKYKTKTYQTDLFFWTQN